MRQDRIRRLIALAACGAAAGSATAQAGVASAAPGHRDQVAALRVSTEWLAQYPPRFWVGVEPPGACAVHSGGQRRCPIAIVLKAWVGGALVDHRCSAAAVLPRPGAKAKPTRTSARCTPVPI